MICPRNTMVCASALAMACAFGCRGREPAPRRTPDSPSERNAAAQLASRQAAGDAPPASGAVTRSMKAAEESLQRLLFDQSSWQAIRAALRRVLHKALEETDRDPASWIAGGDRALERGDWPVAVRCMTRAAELDPNSLNALRALAVALTAAGRFEAVVGVYDRILNRDPSDATARFNLALAAARQRDFARAEAEYRRLLGDRDDFVQAWYNFATILQAQGKLHDAARAWRRVVELAPQLAGAHSSLGEVLVDMGRAEEAMAAYANAARLQPNQAGAWLNFANAAQAAGSLGRAAAALQKAAALAPQDANVQARLGEVYMQMHRVKEDGAFLVRAVAAWETSLRLDARQEALKEKLTAARAALAALAASRPHAAPEPKGAADGT